MRDLEADEQRNQNDLELSVWGSWRVQSSTFVDLLDLERITS
jgi:hypothetical protein